MTKATITAERIDAISEIWVGDDDDSSHVMPMEFTDEAKRWMHVGLCWEGISADQLDRIRVEAWGVHGMGPIPDAMRAHASVLRSYEAGWRGGRER